MKESVQFLGRQRSMKQIVVSVVIILVLFTTTGRCYSCEGTVEQLRIYLLQLADRIRNNDSNSEALCEEHSKLRDSVQSVRDNQWQTQTTAQCGNDIANAWNEGLRACQNLSDNGDSGASGCFITTLPCR